MANDDVMNVSTHPIDLADGRPLGPGESAGDVDTNDPHNADLVESGLIAVVGGERVKKSEQNTAAIEEAAEESKSTRRHHGGEES